jgi:hypothetical protein
MIDWAKYLKDRFQGKNLDENGKPKKRSSKWKKVRNDYLMRNPKCEVCGLTTKTEIHHKVGFAIDPSLELEESNLITLCENKKYGINCHLLIGHLGSYKKINPSVESDAVYWNSKLSWKDK